jgi:tripartite-type tricarboxylate transporter receptor subunit TctC
LEEIAMDRRQFLAAGVGASTLAAPALAQTPFPNRPVTLIVPWAAGGATDVTMRAMADSAAKVLGQPIVVDNRTGGGGSVGPATMAASARPDGYTISQIPISVFRIPLMQRTTWDPLRDFSYIAHLTGYTFGVTVKADSPFQTFQDVIEHARANPGAVTYATPGAATSLHIGMEMIAHKAGVKFTHVPFRGGAETNAAVLGGHTVLQADSSSWKPLVEAKQLRLLVVWTKDRVKSFPDVPTLQEVGFPFVFDSPFGVAGPRGLDARVVKILHDAFKASVEDPAVIETLARFDMFPSYKNSTDYRAFVEATIAEERAAIERLGLVQRG